MKAKVYISGAITGHDIRLVKMRFEAAKERLLKVGCEVVSPLENGLPPDASWEEHMQRDLELLSNCDIIYLLDGWERSKGCKIEFNTAIGLRLTIIFEKSKTNENEGLHKIAEGNTSGRLVS